MRTRVFIALAVVLVVPCWSAGVKVQEHTVPAIEAVPYSPAVCGNWAVAQLNTRYGGNLTIGVVAFDLRTRQASTIYEGKAEGVAVTGSLAMWCRPLTGKSTLTLVGYDLASGQPWVPRFGTQPAADPVACSDYIVFESNHHIYLYSISTGALKRVSDERRVHRCPNVGGDLVVWLEYEDSKLSRSRIRGYRISTGQEYLFSQDFDDANSRPEIDGDYVVWHCEIGGVFYDVKTGKVRIQKFALFPDVSDGFVVYEKPVSPRGEDSHATPRMVCGIDLRANGQEFRISKNQDIHQVFINGTRVVWAEGNTLHYADLTRISELKLSGQ